MSELNVGDIAPDFTLPTATGNVTLADAIASAEKGVIVYFYPKAETPGCTTQACDFRDNLNSLKGAGYTVIGISADSVDALQRFANHRNLNFALASDPDHAVMEAWGAWGEKKLYGRLFTGIKRSTVVVGHDGMVMWVRYNVKAKGHVQMLRRELGIDA